MGRERPDPVSNAAGTHDRRGHDTVAVGVHRAADRQRATVGAERLGPGSCWRVYAIRAA